MGYRSDVRISTNTNGYGRLTDLVGDELATTLAPTTIDFNGDSVILGWDDIKWYDWEGDVRAVMDALRTLREEEYPYEFIRLGESDGDEEFMESEYELLNRHIEVSKHIDVWSGEYWLYRGDVKVTPEEVAAELNLSNPDVSESDVVRWLYKNPTVRDYLDERLHELAVRALADLYKE